MKKNRPFSHSNEQPHNRLAYENIQAQITGILGHCKGDLYDLGCGEMPYKNWISQYVDSYTGVDWSETRHESKADIISDLNKPLPINDEVADTIISISVMEHLYDPQVMLNEAFRIMRPGGTILLQVPFMWWVHEAPHDYYRFTRYGLDYMFRKAGFSDIQIKPTSGFWSMWTLKFNYQSTRFICGPRSARRVLNLLMRVIWATNQRVAPWLDKRWKCEEETGGYMVTARKQANPLTHSAGANP